MKPQTQLTRHASPGSKHVSKSKPSSCSSTFSHLGQRMIKAPTWCSLCLSHHGGQISIVDQPCLPTTIDQRLTTHPSCNNNMLSHNFYVLYFKKKSCLFSAYDLPPNFPDPQMMGIVLTPDVDETRMSSVIIVNIVNIVNIINIVNIVNIVVRRWGLSWHLM